MTSLSLCFDKQTKCCLASMKYSLHQTAKSAVVDISLLTLTRMLSESGGSNITNYMNIICAKVDTRTLCTHSTCSHTDTNCVRNLTFWSVLFKVCHLHNTKVYLYESTSYCLKQTSLCATKIFISIRVCGFYCKIFFRVFTFSGQCNLQQNKAN